MCWTTHPLPRTRLESKPSVPNLGHTARIKIDDLVKTRISSGVPHCFSSDIDYLADFEVVAIFFHVWSWLIPRCGGVVLEIYLFEPRFVKSLIRAWTNGKRRCPLFVSSFSQNPRIVAVSAIGWSVMYWRVFILVEWTIVSLTSTAPALWLAIEPELGHPW